MGQYYQGFPVTGQVNVYVGPDIVNGMPFDGNAMRGPDGTKNYSHFGSQPGSDVIGLFRPPGVPGAQSPKW